MKIEDEEALRYLKALIDGDPPIDAYNTEVLKRAICALEKQVPKKPHKIHDMNVNGHPYYESVCNDCGYVLDEFKDDFCPNCGQAIDWEDYE